MISTRKRYLAAITDHWGGLDLSSFAERLLLQKRVFFTSMLGVRIGFGHSWYIRGPYSPALTRDAYAVSEAKGKGSTAIVALPEHVIQKLEDIKVLFGRAWDEPRQLELLASVCYLARTFNTNDVDFVTGKLMSLKNHFKKDETAEAFDWLAKKALING